MHMYTTTNLLFSYRARGLYDSDQPMIVIEAEILKLTRAKVKLKLIQIKILPWDVKEYILVSTCTLDVG